MLACMQCTGNVKTQGCTILAFFTENKEKLAPYLPRISRTVTSWNRTHPQDYECPCINYAAFHQLVALRMEQRMLHAIELVNSWTRDSPVSSSLVSSGHWSRVNVYFTPLPFSVIRLLVLSRFLAILVVSPDLQCPDGMQVAVKCCIAVCLNTADHRRSPDSLATGKMPICGHADLRIEQRVKCGSECGRKSANYHQRA